MLLFISLNSLLGLPLAITHNQTWTVQCKRHSQRNIVEEIHVKENSTYRHACRLRRQVLRGLPAKGNLVTSVAAIQTSCKASRQIADLRGERISAEVYWVQPRENGPSGLANAAYQHCPSGIGCRTRSRLIGHRSWWGTYQPGPEVRRDDAASINDLCRRQFSPGAVRSPARSFQRLDLAFGEPERVIHDTDGRQIHHESIGR